MRIFVLSVFLLSFSFSNVRAQESDGNPAVVEMTKALKGIAGDLNEVNQKHFSHIYGAYNMIGIVSLVQNKVSATVDACVQDDLTKRYGAWNEVVSPLLEEARGNMDNMILAQDYAQKGDIESLFKLVDAVRGQKASEQVASTEEACEFALKSMDQSQAQMSAMLRATLASFPQQ